MPRKRAPACGLAQPVTQGLAGGRREPASWRHMQQLAIRHLEADQPIGKRKEVPAAAAGHHDLEKRERLQMARLIDLNDAED